MVFCESRLQMNCDFSVKIKCRQKNKKFHSVIAEFPSFESIYLVKIETHLDLLDEIFFKDHHFHEKISNMLHDCENAISDFKNIRQIIEQCNTPYQFAKKSVKM